MKISKTRHYKFRVDLERELDTVKQEHLFRSLRVMGPAGDLLVFADNDYLGLAQHPRVVRALIYSAEKFGAGAAASRLISGTSELHDLLERRIAEFKNKEAALIFGSGYLANLGAIGALAGEKDLIVIDKLCHASIIDGCRLSGATLRVYPHRNVDKLKSILEGGGSFRRKLIVTDSVFSMDGDLAPLRELVAVKKKYAAQLMIDEAHGTGVFGNHGRGVAEYLGVEDEIDVSMGTLSKAVGLMGGFVAGSSVLIDYLINFSRPFIFSTAMPPAIAGAAIESLCEIEQEPELRQRLWQNVLRVRQGLAGLGYSVGASESPIIPILIGDEKKALRMSKFLLAKKIYIPAIRYPAVGKGKARLRLTVSSRHVPADLERLFAALRDARQLL
jgi:glycine C-acetyltransferase/8-amino-7-oxononanoate synthase